MKKIYINPVVQVLTIQTSHMMAVSFSDAPASVNNGYVDLETKGEDDYDLWDEE